MNHDAIGPVWEIRHDLQQWDVVFAALCAAMAFPQSPVSSSQPQTQDPIAQVVSLHQMEFHDE